ncbi:hypothetical protein FIBSPDRAFT_1039573 [Athelia psychrophila]|uniref:Leucine-rich repeat-containing N-terminal plant-type domain-containing protein n=1 Tax=Athelia psychrophila TaxID=1759441 RepID=A0A166RMW1_9AGAM|nr:hypothetical protein FIBSPDRAFT_1039573 [Fibularhizoctonia sp. CBS 109695]
MSVYYHHPTASTSSTSSDQSHRPLRSKFREHGMSIQVPPPPVDLEEIQLERSRFSPESPPPPFRMLSNLRGSVDKKEKFKERDLEAGYTIPAAAPRSGWLTRFLFDARTLFGFQDEQGRLNAKDSFAMPMQDLPVWPPLHIAKHPQPHPAELRKEEKRGRRNRSLIILLIIIILLLASASTFSLVRVLSPRSSSTSSTSTSATQRDISACLSQYTLNAPIAPTSFPCSTCAPLFSPAPTSPALSTADNSTASALLQFCALADIFAAASTSAQANLTNPGGWLTDTDFCSWAGVGCSSTAGTGVVTSLQLTTPGIPSVLSESIGQLAALETFALAGSGSLPAGPLPSSFAGLVGIKTLNIQDTSLTWNDTTGVTDMHGLQEVQAALQPHRQPQALLHAQAVLPELKPYAHVRDAQDYDHAAPPAGFAPVHAAPPAAPAAPLPALRRAPDPGGAPAPLAPVPIPSHALAQLQPAPNAAASNATHPVVTAARPRPERPPPAPLVHAPLQRVVVRAQKSSVRRDPEPVTARQEASGEEASREAAAKGSSAKAEPKPKAVGETVMSELKSET